MNDVPQDAPLPLPRPTTRRWQPLRMGLVDMFYYDDEQFWFHDGRLLLRGNNGTGKSKVLALTLPFLLDGSLQPRRVEPDADAKKRMEWNLLLGGAHPNTERTGYSWIEFGRVDAAGVESYVTLGIGMKAAAGRGIVKHWYFTTDRRIGDLRLIDERRTVLSQERLRDELDAKGTGQLYLRQAAYRRAVDEALFQLGEERYAALIDLLVQLRQPQLSKKPDERALSAALTEALAPLSQAVVADVAESFRSLEEERIGIVEAKETLSAAEAFLRHYRVYAGVASRRHTSALRLKYSEYDHAGRNLRAAEDTHALAVSAVSDLAAEKDGLEERRSALNGQEKALRASPEMREAERLDRVSTEAAGAEDREEHARTEMVQSQDRSEREAEQELRASTLLTEARAAAERSRAAAQERAGAVGLSDEHDGILASDEAGRRALARRREQLGHVRNLIEAVVEAEQHERQARQRLDAAEAEQTARAEHLRTSAGDIAEAAGSYRSAVHRCVTEVSALSLAAETDELTELAEGWAQTLEGDSPVRRALEEAATLARNSIGAKRATAQHEKQRLSASLADVEARSAELEAGRDPEPQSSPARDLDARAEREGAPLWRLIDFSEGLATEEKAGIEAALQSSGLLDAWVLPDGSVSVAGDVVLSATGAEARVALSQYLCAAVAPDSQVDAHTVAAVLSRIGAGEGSAAPLWVSTDGHWGSGPVRGSWNKQHPEFIGAGAREAKRRQELAILRERRAELEGELDLARQRIVDADAEDAAVNADVSSYPAELERQLVAVHERAAAAQLEFERAERACQTALQTWGEAQEAGASAQLELSETASELRLGTSRTELDAVSDALHGYELALSKARSAETERANRQAEAEQAASRLAEAKRIFEQRTAEHRTLRGAAIELRERYTQLYATVGSTVAELQHQLDETTAQLKETHDRLEDLIAAQLKAAAHQGNCEKEVENLRERRELADQARSHASEELRVFVLTGLLRVGVPDLEMPTNDENDVGVDGWTVTSALAIARSAEQLLTSVDESEDSWRKAQQHVSSAHTELGAQMSRYGHTASLEQRGDVVLVRVRYLQEELDIDQLASRLRDDVAARQQLLSAREREILENSLVNEAASYLHELLLAAEEQISGMNRELAERKTSTGMQLRVKWRERVDGPAGLAAVRGQLMRSDATWSSADRAAIGSFLQARIAEIRAEDPAGGWQEHLEQALDYRQWHSFVIERHQGGQWRSASGPASGGERVLAMSVPLFAAAASHYNSAGALAPRLILLDEAFAGVDDDSRAKSLGLLATFDLDVVMTSEREWGCYPQVPGLAIAQLSRVEGVDAVGIVRWQWDGQKREQGPEISPLARAAADSGESAADPGLF